MSQDSQVSKVTALYRYPVKGFTPQPCESLTVQPDGRIAGDRVLAVRFADSATPEDKDGLDYWPKAKGLCLQDFPTLARLRVDFDGRTLTFRDRTDNDAVLVSAGLDQTGRREICDALADWILAGPDAKRLARPGRLPLELVGDGESARFQDRPRGFVSLHSEESVREVEQANGAVPLDDRRFRSNVVIDGVPARTELDWAVDNTDLTVGAVRFTAQKTIVRCMAVTANPDTGVRDTNLLKVLTAEVGLAEPALGVLLLPTDATGSGEVGSDSGTGGVLRIGDQVSVG
ncbi:MOSC domain-containing protein [Corynebacterium variabile]|uniref:MOSC domain-containing protein n=1 Tax=Corynebacterium variabile TaxID=1727 RepID=UPI00289D1A44|nr:MOSC domain-containing protein [Corynebacterium variabile]